MDIKKEALELHERNQGKLEIKSKVKIENSQDLSLAYTPGVAEPCKEIEKDVKNAYKYTTKPNMVAVVTDGSAVLGLGNIGPEAALPVMEGKAILFKNFGDVDAFPICLKTQEVDKIVEIVEEISPGFGGINLEDISVPRCFEIEEKLKKSLDIPVFHDDQHGTAIVVLSGLINALKLVNKEMKNLKVVINGAGAAGTAIGKLLYNAGVKDIIMIDIDGIIKPDRKNLDSVRKEFVEKINPRNISGTLNEAIVGADVFVGVSAAGVLKGEMVKQMGEDAIIFAMANPDPEIYPDEAKENGARIVGTGRSDFPNQVNNVLAFPGIFKGALKARAKDINEEMKLAAAEAIANYVKEEDLNEENIIPYSFDKNVSEVVAKAVYDAAVKSGVARLEL